MRCLLLALSTLASAAAASPDLFPREMIPQLPIVAMSSKNPRCREDSQMLLENLHNSTTWAMRMWDASAKGEVGLLAGNMYQLGNFDACVAQVHPMRAQYCLATMTLSAGAMGNRSTVNGTVWGDIIYNGHPSKIRRDVIHWALCVPASCSHVDIEASINLHLAAIGRNNSLTVTVKEEACQTGRQEETLSTGAIVFCVVMTLIAGFAIGVTVYDFQANNNADKDRKSNAIGYLLCFSIRKNFSELPLREDCDLNFIHGIRVMITCIVILGHRVAHTIARPLQNYEYIEQFSQQHGRIYAIIFFKGDIIVDAFFVLGGVLCTYCLCVTLDKRKDNPVRVIIMRYVRLTPVFAVLVGFYATLIYHVSDGPLWQLLMTSERDACVQNWWTGLLYVSNYVNESGMCMIHSWYLASDTHYFIVAILVVTVLHKRPYIGISILTALIFSAILVPFLITYLGQKDPLVYFYPDFLNHPRTHQHFLTMYIKSHIRAGPYFVGVAMGYIAYRSRDIKKNFVWSSRAGFIISALFGIAAVIPASKFYDPNWENDPLQAALFAGIHRTAFAIGAAGIGFSILFNKNSIFNIIFSWPPLTVFSKLAYCQYLTHFAMQTIYVASLRSPQHFDMLTIFSHSFSDIFWSLIIALPLHLIVEVPLRLVFKLLLDPRSAKKKPNSENLRSIQKFEALHDNFTAPRKSSVDHVIPVQSLINIVEGRASEE